MFSFCSRCQIDKVTQKINFKVAWSTIEKTTLEGDICRVSGPFVLDRQKVGIFDLVLPVPNIHPGN